MLTANDTFASWKVSILLNRSQLVNISLSLTLTLLMICRLINKLNVGENNENIRDK